MTPGPIEFRGPMGFKRAHHEAGGLQGAQQRAHGLHKAYRNGTEKSVCGRSKTFFFEITSKSGENRGILP